MSRASSGAELTTSPPSTAQLAPGSSSLEAGPGDRPRGRRRGPSRRPSAAERRPRRPPRRPRRARRRGRSRPRGRAAAASRSGGSRAPAAPPGRRCGSAAPPARSPARPGLRPVLAQRHDLGRGPQRVADPRRPAQRQAAVEEVADHPLGEQRSTGRSRRRRRGRGGRAAARGRAPRRRARRRAPAAAGRRGSPGAGRRGPRSGSAPGRRRSTWPTRRSSKKGAAGASALTRPAPGPVRSSRRAAAGHRLVDHLAFEGDGAGAGGLRLGQRRQHRLGLLDLRGARGEGVGDRLQLPRVDRPLAVEARRRRCGPRPRAGRRCRRGRSRGPSIACRPWARAASSTRSWAPRQVVSSSGASAERPRSAARSA